MRIESLTKQANLELLSRSRLGRLACSQNGQPYITPIFFAHERDFLYGFSTLGRKIDWMRSNPLVCVEVDDVVTAENWVSVILLGRYEELTTKPEHAILRNHAHALLQKHPIWWEPGYVKTVIEGQERSLDLIYFRIHIDQITGHRGIPDDDSDGRSAAQRPVGWFQKILSASHH